MGRARHQAGRLSEALEHLGAEVIEVPFIEIHAPASFDPLDNALTKIAHYDWLILTSANGVDALFSRMQHLGISAASLSHLKVAAIGPATRKGLEAHGLQVHAMPPEYVAEAVVSALRDHVKQARVLLVRAKVARDVIPRELAAAGAQMVVVEAYETLLPESSRQRLAELLTDSAQCPHVIPFTSSSTVRNFVELAGREPIDQALRAGVKLASIGPVTSGTLRELGLPVHFEANEYTIAGLLEAIVRAIA
ncbi:MAG: uroporphyrinogen-III synthase [Candidatus Korobacteraceae bacterium]